MVLSNYLTSTILEATRVANVYRNGKMHLSETLIDNIFVNRSVEFKSGLIYSNITDHYPIFTSISNKNLPNPTSFTKTIKIRLIDDFRIRKFRSALQQAFINSLDKINDAELAFSTYYNTFNLLYDKYFPVVEKLVKEKSISKPWVSDALLKGVGLLFHEKSDFVLEYSR